MLSLPQTLRCGSRSGGIYSNLADNFQIQFDDLANPFGNFFTGCQIFIDHVCVLFNDFAIIRLTIDNLVRHLVLTAARLVRVTRSRLALVLAISGTAIRIAVAFIYLCGDETSDTADTIGLVAPRVMVCAAHQAHTVLRILAGEFDV